MTLDLVSIGLKLGTFLNLSHFWRALFPSMPMGMWKVLSVLVTQNVSTTVSTTGAPGGHICLHWAMSVRMMMIVRAEVAAIGGKSVLIPG